MPRSDEEFDPAIPARLSAALLRELADVLEKKGKGWAMVILVKDGVPTGYVPEAAGLLPEHIKEALGKNYDVNVVAPRANVSNH
jgi:hypothetical protein